MPKQVQDIKQFLEICRRKDARCSLPPFLPSWTLAARIQKSYSKLSQSKQTKFKVRCSRFVYTLAIDDSDKADKIRQSLPPCMCPIEVTECSIEDRGNRCDQEEEQEVDVCAAWKESSG